MKKVSFATNMALWILATERKDILLKPIDNYCLMRQTIDVKSNALDTGGEAMETPKIFESEYHFCLIMWEREPVTAAELAKLCQDRLGWKRTTTYPVIKRLGDRGVLKNKNGVITALVSKEAAQAREIDALVEEKFQGSLPAFVAAFTKRQDISNAELDEVQRMIDRIRKGE